VGDNQHRYHNLEGLRGLAAFVVVIWHFTVAFLPFVIGFSAVSRHFRYEHLVANTPLFLPFAGTFSVLVFFVLSGFVLSLSFFRRKDVGVLVSSASRRYFRLMLPAFGSVLFAYIIMRIGDRAHLETAQITGSPWLTWYWNFQPHFWGAIHQGAFGVFFNDSSVTATNLAMYNSNLWTMYVELLGSFIVFAILAFFGRLQKRWLIYGALAIIFSHSYFLAFLLGVAICDVWVNFPSLKDRLHPLVAWGLLAFGIVAGSWHNTFNIHPSYYSAYQLPFFTIQGTEQFMRTLGAACLIIAVLRMSWLTRFFESRPLQYLGRISFALYLLHFAVIYSFSCLLFNRLLPHLGYAKSFGVMFSISLPLILVLSHFYTKWVDVPAIQISKRVGNWLTAPLSKRAASNAQQEQLSDATTSKAIPTNS